MKGILSHSRTTPRRSKMPEGRPQLYKIRRTCRIIPNSIDFGFEWWTPEGWVPDKIDGEAFTSILAAQKVVEPIKARSTDPTVVYHSVVPA